MDAIAETSEAAGVMARSRPILNVTRLRGRSGEEAVTLEVTLLGPDPAASRPDYAARLTVDPDGHPVDVDVVGLLRALSPAGHPP